MDWTPQVGDTVCNCYYEHRKVKSLDLEMRDAVLEDDRLYSIDHCLEPVPHPDYEHPDPAPRAPINPAAKNRHG